MPYHIDRPLSEWPVEWKRAPWLTACSVNSETWNVDKGTLVRWEMDGPEDAQLFVSGFGSGRMPRISLLFSSFPPDACFWTSSQPQVQMYLAAEALPDPSRPAQGEHLSCQSVFHSEKNWIPFLHGETLYFFSTLNPQTVMKTSLNGTCEKVHSEKSPLLSELSVAQNNTFLKGSATAVFVDSPGLTPWLPRPHYLGLLHYSDQQGPYSYVTHAFRFEPDPPFRVLQLSDSLPLTEKHAPPEQGSDFTAPFAWASSLSLFEDTVVIGYGAGDKTSRALVLTLERLDQFFADS